MKFYEVLENTLHKFYIDFTKFRYKILNPSVRLRIVTINFRRNFKMKKLICLGLAVLLAAVALAGCGGERPLGESGELRGLINVVTREDGSGTRSAFIEMLGIDDIFVEANVQNGTSAVINAIAGSANSIGYSSLGSIEGNTTVRAITIDGIAPSNDTIRNETYPISRDFRIVTTTPNEIAQDFIDFIFSAEGQAIVDGSYIAVNENAPAFTGGTVSGSITVGGSTSVAPLVTDLARAYMELNGNVTISVQPLGSSAGINGAIDGLFDIGLASRPLTSAELANATETIIAVDGIAVIVPAASPITNLTKAQVADIFEGVIERWENI